MYFIYRQETFHINKLDISENNFKEKKPKSSKYVDIYWYIMKNKKIL